jgi:hypothetical protein
MPRIKRRQFLQFAGSTLAALGVSQLDILRQGHRYARVLAQDTPRKLALLVGINRYPSPIRPLNGCVTDVELQRELLIHRFGFMNDDIAIVTDAQATREGILTAFEEHLIKQAREGDVVVFHFSGHGSQVSDQPECDAVVLGESQECVNSTMVPFDSFLPETGLGGGVVNDITGHTLFLLMSALPTEWATVVLDSCHSGGGTRGNFIVRAVPRLGGGQQFSPSEAEKQYQQQWLSRLNLSPAKFIEERRAGVAKGAVIASARREQYAADAPFSDFHAGAFSYAMTRYLWQQTSNEGLGSALVRINLSAKKQAATNGIEQDPVLEVKPGSDKEERPFFFVEKDSPAAEGVVTQVSGNQFDCWLGGADSLTLVALGEDSLFTLIDAEGQERGEVKLLSRNGLTAKGELLQGSGDALQEGALLQEKVRLIPRDLPLDVGLDPSLGDEAAQAESVLQQLSRVRAFPAGGEGEYLLGRLTEEYALELRAKGVEELPEVGSVGLFSPGLDQFISDSFSVADEPAAASANRLRSKFTLLLAGKMLKALLNPHSSQLAVDADVSPVLNGRGGQPIAAIGTSRGRQPGGSARANGRRSALIADLPSSQQVEPGTTIEINVANREEDPIYIAILAIASDGQMIALFPTDWTAPGDAALVAAGETLTIPRPDSDFAFQVKGPSGIVEVLVLASRVSLRNALKGLQRIAERRGMRSGELGLDEEAAEAVEDLLAGLDDNTRASLDFVPTNQSRSISTDGIAAMSIAIEVVA